MTARRYLPNRRSAESFEFEVAGLHYTCTIGRYPDGTIGEIFLNNHRSNSAADVNARDAAIATSIALQFGADIEIIRKALCRDSDGKASGPLGSALDLLRLPERPTNLHDNATRRARHRCNSQPARGAQSAATPLRLACDRCAREHISITASRHPRPKSRRQPKTETRNEA
jgi:hypothetical protein